MRAAARIPHPPSALRAAGALLALAVLAALALPPDAGAHAVLLQTRPDRGAIVDEAPREVVLVFNEPVGVEGGALRVLAGDGGGVERGEIRRIEGGRGIAIDLEDGLEEGSYTVSFRVTSADAHVITGAFVFSVGRPGPTYQGPLVEGASTAADMSAAAVRWLQFAGLVVLLGALVFLERVWRPLRAAGAAAVGAGLEAAERAFRRVAHALLAAGWAALALAAVAALPVHAWQTHSSLSGVAGTRFGQVGIARLALVALLAPALALGLRRGMRWARPAALVLVAAGCALPGLSGHASTADLAAVAIALDWLHVLAAGVWGGGLALLALAVPAARRHVPEQARRPFLLGAIRRFSTLALTSVAVLAVSGTVAAIREVGSLDALVDTPYGRVLLLKLALVLAALALAAHNRRAPRRFVTQVRVEALVLVGVVAATAALTGLAPGTSASRAVEAAAGPSSIYTSLGTWELAFEVTPARAATDNEVHVVLTNAVGQPAFDARDATLTAELADAGVGRIEIPLRLLSTAHWIGNVVFPQPGRWEVRLSVRRGEFGVERLVETIAVQPAG